MIDKCLSAVLVIVSLCVIRAIIKTFKVRTKQRNLSSRDCLMTIYGVCFVLVILSNICFQGLYFKTSHSDDYLSSEFCN